MRPAPAHKQAGIAAITAMLVVALATVLAVELLWSSSLDVRRTQNLVERDQAKEIAFGLELLAGELLRADFEDDPAIDSLQERWAEEYGFPFEGGNVVGRLQDVRGKFDLNSLINTSGERQPGPATHFQRLVELVVAEDRVVSVDAESVVDSVVDWLDANTQPDGIGGAEDGVYTSRTPPYRAGNFWFTTTSELLAVDNVTPELYSRLAPLLTALPPQSAPYGFNINTILPPVLQSMEENLSAADAAALLEMAPFETLEDFQDQSKNTLPDDFWNPQGENRPQPPTLDVATDWFSLTVIVSVGSTRLSMYSLLERNAADGRVIARLRSFDTP